MFSAILLMMATPEKDLEKLISSSQPAIEEKKGESLSRDTATPVVDANFVDGKIKTSGKLTQKEVRRALAVVGTELRACYDRMDPKKPLSLPLSFDVNAEGAPVEIVLAGEDEKLTACLRGQIAKMRFKNAGRVKLKLRLSRSAT